MDITISGYEGENVIAQIIEDLLTVNGLSVKRDDLSPISGTLNIDQLDTQLSVLRKNKVTINIKVLKEDRPKYLPKKMPKFKTNLPDLQGLISRTTAVLDAGFGDDVFNFDAPVAYTPTARAAAVPAAPAAARAPDPAHYNWPVIQAQVANPEPLRAGDQVLFAGAPAVAQQVRANIENNFVGYVMADQVVPAPAINPQEVADEMPAAPRGI